MTYAKIVNNTVVNLLEIRRANAHEFPDCVSTNNFLVEIGDTYEDGNFFRNGELVKSNEIVAAEMGATEVMAIITGEVAI